MRCIFFRKVYPSYLKESTSSTQSSVHHDVNGNVLVGKYFVFP